MSWPIECTYPGCERSVDTHHIMCRWADGDDQWYCLEHYPGEPDPIASILQAQNFGDPRSLEDALHDAGYILERNE